MRELADKMGVEAPSLYNHIESKIEILREICFSIADQFNTHMNTVIKSSEDEVAKTESIIRFHIKMMLTRYNEVYVSNHEWKHLKEPEKTKFLILRRQYEQNFVSIIDQGIIKNKFKKVNPQTAVLVILSAVRGLEFFNIGKRKIQSGQLANDITTLLIKGLVQ